MNRTLRCVVDRIVPAGAFPSASALGALEYVEGRLAALGEPRTRDFWSGLEALEREAAVGAAAAFASLPPAVQDAVLERVERGEARTPGSAGLTSWFAQLVAWVMEAVYARPAGSGSGAHPAWFAIGYGEREPESAEHTGFAGEGAIAPEYDAVVVGAGVAGSIVAGVLAQTGKTVLVLERGSDATLRARQRDHLSNHRLSLYGHNTGPELEGHPRVAVDARGQARVVLPHQADYHNNAVCIGGGGLVFGGMAFRFHPDDFRMQSRYGRPERSSLADWPLDYDELEPYYERVEWEIGVAGEPSAAPGGARAYPMPPHTGHPGRARLRAGAARLGLATSAVPLLINSRAYRGRAACARCNACVGFACPTDAKNGGHNTFLSAALARGNVSLRAARAVERVQTDAQGRVTGVSFFGAEPGAAARYTVRARHVVVAGGAIESARLLLHSASAREPTGLGNGSDQLGRHLQGHVYATALGLMPEAVEAGFGPGPSIATRDLCHGNPGVVGGGVMSDDFVLLPIVAWRSHLPPGLARWGAENQRFMCEDYRRLLKIVAPAQEIPNPESRVTLDPHERDRFGVPVARLSGSVHPESVQSAEFLRRRAEDWLRASGALEVWSSPLQNADFLSAGQHQAGTCRMGKDPASSVTDEHGRVHGHDNLWVMDASLHVTGGGVNPVLTVMALALRNAETLARLL